MATKIYRNTAACVVNIGGKMARPGGTIELDSDRVAELSKTQSFGAMLLDGTLTEEKPAKGEKTEK